MHPSTSSVSARGVIPNKHIVVLKDDQNDETFERHIQSVMSQGSGRVTTSSGSSSAEVGGRCTVGNFRAYYGTFDDQSIEHIKNSPEVDFVEQDQVMTALDITSQSNVPSWGLARISQKKNTDLTTYHYKATAGEGVVAYVIDTGINIEHVDFEGRATWGTNTADSTNDDEAGHGTHVAGTIGGATHGVAKKVSLVAVKVLGGDGSGTTSGVIQGIEWATSDARKKGSAKSVANMSLGGGYSAALNKAVEAAVASGITFCVAAGNENEDAKNSSPASVPSAITVGATDKTDARASYSDYGSLVDVFAPGTDITSTWIGSKTATNTISGTSMATPHIAGLSACLIAAEGLSGPAAVVDRIKELASLGTVSNAGPETTDALAYNGSGH